MILGDVVGPSKFVWTSGLFGEQSVYVAVEVTYSSLLVSFRAR